MDLRVAWSIDVNPSEDTTASTPALLALSTIRLKSLALPCTATNLGSRHERLRCSMKLGFMSMAYRTASGCIRARIPFVTAPVPGPNSAMTRARLKSTFSQRAAVRNRELGTTEAVERMDLIDS